MDTSYIYFKEIDIDKDKNFTANFSEENEKESVMFNKGNEYGVTGLNINSVLPDEKILKIENIKEKKKLVRKFKYLLKKIKNQS